MIRSFMMLLVLVVVFLAGMLFGVEKGQHLTNNHFEEQTKDSKEDQTDAETEVKKETNESEEKKDSQGNHENQYSDISNNEYFTHKTASFLEKGVKGFYNIIVEVMYQFSNIFF